MACSHATASPVSHIDAIRVWTFGPSGHRGHSRFLGGTEWLTPSAVSLSSRLTRSTWFLTASFQAVSMISFTGRTKTNKRTAFLVEGDEAANR